MAQVIKIKRGGIANLITTTPTLAQGELLLATGSLNGLGSTFFVADAANSPELPYAKIESVANGATLAASLDTNFTGLLIHSASNNKLYRYDGSDFVELPIAAGSFVGVLPVTNGGTGQSSLDDIVGDSEIIVTNGTGTVIGGNVTLSLGGGVVSGSSQIDGTSITNNTVSFGGVSVALGSSDATPAFNLADATGLPIVNGTTGTLTVGRGGTGATTLTDHGVLVGSGTGAITALSVGTNGQLLIGQSGADPSFNTVSGVININNTGTTSFTSTANTLISGSFTSVSASIASDINTNTNAIVANALNINSLTAATSSYYTADSDVTLAGDVTGTADSNTVGKIQGVAITSNEATQLANIGTTTISATQWGYLGAMNQGVTTTSAVTFATVNTGQGANELYAMDQDVQTTDSPSFAGVTGGNITVGVTGDNTIDTTSGNLTIDSTGGTTNITDNVVITGDLTVTGTTTTVNTTELVVTDNTITVNYGGAAANAGILAIDSTGGTTGTGSLQWNGTNDYWMAGVESSEKRIVLQDANMTANSFVIATGAGTINDVTPSTSGDILQWNGSSMVASNVIDGGTF